MTKISFSKKGNWEMKQLCSIKNEEKMEWLQIWLNKKDVFPHEFSKVCNNSSKNYNTIWYSWQ